MAIAWSSISPGPDFFRKALYRVFTWAEIEPIYGQPWKESQAKAVVARKAAAKARREGEAGR
jgi:hypothetical protein